MLSYFCAQKQSALSVCIAKDLSTNIYWVRHAKKSQAEVDYISSYLQVVVPVEVKADTQGGMKSLWAFMRDKKLHYAIRCSMENFGKFDYVDNEANGEVRHVRICPMYAVANIEEVKQGIVC